MEAALGSEELQLVSRGTAKLRRTGKWFVTGLGSSYDSRQPEELGHVDAHMYSSALRQINSTLEDHWPCQMCYFCGFACIPLTLGLSLCIPNCCVADVRV